MAFLLTYHKPCYHRCWQIFTNTT